MCWGGIQDDFKTGYWKGAGTDLQDCDAEGPYPPIHERQTARPRCLLWVKRRHAGIVARCPLFPRKRTVPRFPPYWKFLEEKGCSYESMYMNLSIGRRMLLSSMFR